jgi:hypothetical protein
MPRQKRGRDSDQPEFLREARTKDAREELQRQAAKAIEEAAVGLFLLAISESIRANVEV